MPQFNFENNVKVFNSSVEIYDKSGLKEVEQRVIDKYFIKDEYTLDVGCGTGRTTSELYRRGYPVVGVDIAENMVKKAKERYYWFAVEVMDVSNLKYKDKSFSNVLFSYNGLDFLHPKEKRIKALKEILRVLKPKGIFAFSSRNSRFIPNNAGRARIWLRNLINGNLFRNYRINYQKSGNLIVYSAPIKSQVEDLKNVGFTILDIMGIDSNKWYSQFFEACPYYICTKT